MATMAQIGSAFLGRLLVHTAAPVTTEPTTQSAWAALFDVQGTNFDIFPNLAQIPALGNQPSTKSVAEFGRMAAREIRTQSASQALELVVNFKPSLWVPGTTFGDLVKNRTETAFAFAAVEQEPPNFQMVQAVAGDPWLGDVGNWVLFWTGRFESMIIEPATDNETVARISVTVTSSDFHGPYGF